MRIVIIGGGFGFTTHLPALQSLSGVEVAGVADSGSGRLRDRLPSNVAYLPSWKEALAIPADAVIVVVPPSFQFEIVWAALAKGRHILCDKPFGISLEEAGRMVAKSLAAGVVTGVNFQIRYEPGVMALRKLLGAGKIGSIQTVEFSWLTSGRANPGIPWTWRNDVNSGGGVIGAFFSHAADMLWWLTGKEVASVSGKAEILHDYRIDEVGHRKRVTAEDAITAQLVLEGEIDVSCEISNCRQAGDGLRIVVQGSEGMLEYRHRPPFGPSTQSIEWIDKDKRTEIPIPDDSDQEGTPDTRIYAVQQLLTRFVERVRGEDGNEFPEFLDGLRVHRAMDGLRRSIELNEAVEV